MMESDTDMQPLWHKNERASIRLVIKCKFWMIQLWIEFELVLGLSGYAHTRTRTNLIMGCVTQRRFIFNLYFCLHAVGIIRIANTAAHKYPPTVWIESNTTHALEWMECSDRHLRNITSMHTTNVHVIFITSPKISSLSKQPKYWYYFRWWRNSTLRMHRTVNIVGNAWWEFYMQATNTGCEEISAACRVWHVKFHSLVEFNRNK